MKANSQMRGVPARGDAAIVAVATTDRSPVAASSSKMPGVSRRGRAPKVVLTPIHDVAPTAPIQIGGNADDERGQLPSAAHSHGASLVTYSEIVNRKADESEVGQACCDSQCTRVDLANTIAEIREQWRRRQAWHRAEKSLTLQSKALCRRLVEGGDKGEADKLYKAALGKGRHVMADVALAAISPLTKARDSIEIDRKTVEKRLTKLAKELPISPWVEGTRGVGILSLAAIIGEAGDLQGYDNPAKLWKRLGLAVMADGTRQRRVGGAEALDHGYSPARRSVVWNIGACIVKAGGPLKAVYDARKVYEAERVETKAHAHNRAQRYTEKRFLKLLWSEWRRCGVGRLKRGTQGSAADPAY